jgi:hypothetical protein
MNSDFPDKSDNPEPQNGANYNRASVPISVYRQLAGELNMVKTELTALKSENQQLRNNNQQLQQQVAHVMNAAERLKSIVNQYDFGLAMPLVVQPTIPTPMSNPSFAVPLPLENAISAPQPPQRERIPEPEIAPIPRLPERSTAPRKVIETIAPPDFPHHEEAEPSGGINAFAVIGAIFLIVLTSLGAGYLIVLPLMNQKSPK